jgi:hypothetical protein
MRFISAIRWRSRRIIGAAIGTLVLLAMGAIAAFILSPSQAILARRIERLPEMDASRIREAQSGTEILVTGRLQDNKVIEGDRFVAYTLQEWDVTLPDPEDDDDEPEGTWRTRERDVPDLTLNVNNQTVRLLSANNATLSGPLHKTIIRGYGWDEAKYKGEWLPEGSLRLRGFYNGDLVTALGKKASSPGVIPDELYAGDRVAFATSKRRAARSLLIGGLCMMGASPLILLFSIFGPILGRRRWR